MDFYESNRNLDWNITLFWYHAFIYRETNYYAGIVKSTLLFGIHCNKVGIKTYYNIYSNVRLSSSLFHLKRIFN